MSRHGLRAATTVGLIGGVRKSRHKQSVCPRAAREVVARPPHAAVMFGATVRRCWQGVIVDPESLSSMSDEEFLALLEQALPAGAWPADQVFELLERGESLLAGRPELAVTMAPEIADAKAVAESARKALAPMLNTLNAT